MKTLQFIMVQINRFYNVNFSSLKRILKGIINDEERHRQILPITKKALLEKKTKADFA